jgi:hypothetical protein
MKLTVSRFESHLLRILYYFLGREPPESGLRLVEAREQPPPCLSRAAVRLAGDALAKGCVHLLASRGGWRNDRFLRNGKAVEGRLWQRSPPADLALTFSRHSLDFLIWLTTARPGDKEPFWGPPHAELASGDHLLLYFAHQGLRGSADSLGAPEMRLRTPFVEHGLCRLAYPEDFAAVPAGAGLEFDPWTNGVGAAILEAVQPELEARWVQVEGAKESIAEPERMRALGRSQERVLTVFLDAVEAANRLDLARFLLAAAARLLGPPAGAEMWTRALQTRGLRLADRAATYQAALAFLRQLDRLQRWERRARSVGYFDDDYAASQLWKAAWEHYEGDVVCERARAIVRDLDPMRSQSN